MERMPIQLQRARSIFLNGEVRPFQAGLCEAMDAFAGIKSARLAAGLDPFSCHL
jgi:hypothetical protein